jgi:hypothetical protein
MERKGKGQEEMKEGWRRSSGGNPRYRSNGPVKLPVGCSERFFRQTSWSRALITNYENRSSQD